MRRFRSLPWLLASTAWLAFASPPAWSQGFAESADVVAVEVPIQVVRDGEPVRGLSAADFEVYDGRKKQEITGFEVLDLYAQGKPSAAPGSARRHFLLLFDLAFSEPGSIVRAREAARDLVLQGLHPTDLVAVATYSSSRGSQLILGFTSDRRQVDAALDSLGLPTVTADRAPDPLRLVLVQAEADGRKPGDPSRGLPAQPRRLEVTEEVAAARNEALLDQLSTLGTEGKKANLASQQTAVTALARSFVDLGKLMGTVLGRKHVVYLSEGFNTSLVTGTTDQARTDEMREQSLHGENYLASSEEKFGDSKSLNDIERMLEEFRRSDCVIQAVDIGGIRAGADPGTQRAGGKDSLFQMARSTGGELYENANDLSAAMDQMLKRTGVTYVLAFQPEKLKKDGAYHRLKVELKGPAAKGARVVYRPGYYAPKSYGTMTPLEKLLETASQLTSGEEKGPIAASVLAAPFRTAGEAAYVPVLIEIDGPGLLAGGQGTALPTEIYVYAMDESGAIRDFLTQTLGFDLAKAEAALRASGLKFFGHLDLPPGRYSVRVLVRNGLTGAYSLRVVPVDVPDFAQGLPALLPPFFPEPANRWLMARETQQAGAPQVQYPFMLKQQPYVPASRPVLTGEQESAMALVGYHLPAGDLNVRSRVLTRDGKEAGAGEVRLLSREGGGTSSPDRLAATFRPPKLPPGEYLLEVTVSDPSGAAQTSTTPFAVGGAPRS
jgi:VWFA-related protein